MNVKEIEAEIAKLQAQRDAILFPFRLGDEVTYGGCIQFFKPEQLVAVKQPGPPWKVGDTVTYEGQRCVIDRVDAGDPEVPYRLTLPCGGYSWARTEELS